MFTSKTLTFLLGAAITSQSLSFTNASPTPIQHARAVTELNEEAFKEAHSRDNGATRAFAGVEIKTSDGRCLFIDELSGDFRANLTPVQVAACDGSQGQLWDIITSGIHNNVPGKMLVVNTLIQGCLDLNQGRVGREVTTFSCGGRADGGGQVTPDQLFPFPANPSSFSLTTDRGNGNCLAVKGNALGIAPCAANAATQTFSIGGNGGNGGGEQEPPSQETPAQDSSSSEIIAPTSTAVSAPASEPTATAGCTLTTIITMVRNPATVTVFESAPATEPATAPKTRKATRPKTRKASPTKTANASAPETAPANAPSIPVYMGPGQVRGPTYRLA